MQFSFNQNYLHITLKDLSQLFPTASLLLALENKENTTKISKFEFQKETIFETDVKSNAFDFEKLFFVKNSNFVWQNESDLPFLWSKDENQPNIDMFHELNRNVLLLRINNANWRGYILIYFSKGKKHFGLLDSQNSVFNHENREIIGHISYNFINNNLNNIEKNKEVLKNIQNSINFLSENRKLSDTGNMNQVKMLENMIVEMATEYLQNLATKENIEIILSPDAKTRIQSFRGQPSDLRNTIYNAAILALNLSKSNPVVIESWHLIPTTNKAEVENAEIEYSIKENQMKIYKWLDRIEDAVKIVISSNNRPTGALVGKNMEPAISAPAISDMMNKRRNKILTLLNEFPDRWQESRKYFKPLQNLMIKKEEDNIKIA